MSKLLEVISLSKVFRVSRGLFRSFPFYAVRDVSFWVNCMEVFALVGESGSGKSTIGKVILRLEKPTYGEVKFEGKNIFLLGKEYTKKVAAVFQDPRSSLNPYMKIEEIMKEPLLAHGIKEKEKRLKEVVRMVKLPEDLLERRPENISGGQRQRVAIGRALSLSPRLIVADEPTASLDATIRKDILMLFSELKKENISTILITHDIRAVELVADRVGVIYGGRLMEVGDKEEVLQKPKHPYTKYLLANLPVKHPRDRKMRTFEDSKACQNGNGCPFYPLCPERIKECEDSLREVYKDGRFVACNLY
ncbi:MAG: ABC transporter ATP-binding protein [Aquificaceae bacterium]